MRISTRLSLISSLISSTIFIALGVTVYQFSSNHRKQDFQTRLQDRVIITEKIFLEKESFGPAELEKITNQFLHTLPQETEEVLLIEQDSLPAFKHQYLNASRNQMLKHNSLNFTNGIRQGASRKFTVNGKNYLVAVTAIDVVGKQHMSFLKKIIILLVLIGIPLIFVWSFIITRRALLPITKKIEKANSISASNLNERLHNPNPHDELGEMTSAFNKVLDRLETSFESQKSFIRNASHEIRNPLTAIMGEAEIALTKSRSDEEYRESLRTILNAAETLNSTVNNLLQLSLVTANEENIQYEVFPFDNFLKEVKESFDFLNPENQIHLNIERLTGHASYNISGNLNLLKTALINIFDNACKYSENKKIDVRLTQKNEQVNLVIKDQGIGIVKEDLEKITALFYRGNNARGIKGSGIGLSLSTKIIRLHLGSLKIHSEIGKGTEVQVFLPLC